MFSLGMFSFLDAGSEKAGNLIKIEWRLCQMGMMKQDKGKGVMIYKREIVMIDHEI